jgi:hypothetical protein
MGRDQLDGDMAMADCGVMDVGLNQRMICFWLKKRASLLRMKHHVFD